MRGSPGMTPLQRDARLAGNDTRRAMAKLGHDRKATVLH
jgi:hypothetical protein